MHRLSAPLLLFGLLSLSACGSTSTGGASATACAAGSSTPAPSASPSAASLELTVADLPCAGPRLTQVSDGLLNNTPNTAQRVFANSGNTYRVEDDIIVDTSASQAHTDYQQFADAAKKNYASVSATSSPSGLGSDSTELAGTAPNGYSLLSIAWDEGSVLVALLFESSTGPVDQTFAEDTAHAQANLILNNGSA